MRKLIYTAVAILTISQSIAQEPPKPPQEPEEPKSDTTRTSIGKIHITKVKDKVVDVNYNCNNDTIDASPSDEEMKRNEAHWAGLDLGVNVMLDNNYNSNFPNNPYWENDPSSSFNFNLNLMEHKFNIYKHYVGITTGLGFNFAQYGFKNNYILTATLDSIYAVIDTMNNYTKNKLKATYLQIPLLIEFNTNELSDKSFYLTAGVVGGVRLSSKTKRKGELDGKEFEQKSKGFYALNSFKLDATVRVGYSDWGAFATYALIPLFESGKTVPVHPFSVGLTHNF